MPKKTTILLLIAISSLSCQTASRTPQIHTEEAEIVEDRPLSLEEHALVLQLEDRREFDRAIAEDWIRARGRFHRERMALALGRIGTATFVDENGDGEKDDDELMAGAELLSSLHDDPADPVRVNVAFALGEIGDPAGVPALLAMAREDDSATVRSEAVEALSKLAEHVSLDHYIEFVSANQPTGVRVTALRYLFRFDGDEPLEIARRYLDSDSMLIRRAATYVFNRRAHPPALEDLTLRLRDDDVLTRSYAARGIDRIGDPKALELPLLGAVRDAHPWVRTNALRAIASIALEHPAAFADWASERTVAPILLAADDPDPGTKATAIETLGVFAPHLDSVEAELLRISKEEEPAFRESAIRALAGAYADDSDRIESLAQTEDRWVRIILLQETSGAMTGPSLRARYADDPDSSVRSAVVATIPDDQVESEKSIVIRALSDPDPVVRASAIGRASKSSDVDPVLSREQERRAREDRLNDARLAALSLIAENEGRTSEEWFRELLTDRDPVVRRVAADAIESFGFKRPQYTPLETDHSPEWYLETAEWASKPHSAVIETVRGPIELLLLTAEAPITTRNFADLASSGYYDGTSFMRVVPNFVIQGGDPRNDMTGGPGYSIRDEINLQKYTRGAVGMALSGPDTGGSQYFVTHSPQHHLDGGYTIFGRVTDGMAGVVDQIRRGDRVSTIRIDAAISTDEQSVRDQAREPLPLEVGPITRSRTLETIPEYQERFESYEPDDAVISMMAPLITEQDRIDVFLGTWCRDSQREMPKFYRIIDELSEKGVKIPVDYVAVDRSKTEPQELVAYRSIELVPTFIVMRGDEEIGRIVETPVSLLEDDLLAILAGANR